MTTLQIQKIFRNQHILILDVMSNEDWSFDEESLSRLGPFEQEQQMQGKFMGYF